MWKHDNNLLWHLNPRKLLWHFQIGSFIWICCLGHKPSTLSLIPPRIMFLEGAVPPLSTSEVPPAPARDTRAPMAMVSKAKRHWGPSAWESSPRPGRPWEPWSGSVQQTQMLMIDPKNFKTKSYLFILLCPHHMHKHSKADTLPHTILLSFPEKPSLHICTAAEAARNMCTEQRGGSLAGHVAVAAQSQPVSAWPSLLALTEGMQCLATSLLTGWQIWMILCWGIETLPAESRRLSTTLCQGMALSHQAPVCHYMTQWHVWSQCAVEKCGTSVSSIRGDGKCISNPWNRVNVLYINCIYTYLGIDASFKLDLYSLKFYSNFSNLLLKLLNRYSKLNLEWMY